MDPLAMTAASGLRARMESLDLLANNIANSETSGYKSDREFYNIYVAAEAQPTDGQDPSTMPVIEKSYTDYSPGNLRVTANPTDLAIDGNGFFAVDSPAGVAYTRNGAFRISPAGALVTAEGYPVRSNNGSAIHVNTGVPMTITPDGIVRQSGQDVARLGLYDFSNPASLVKQGNTLFRAADSNVQPTTASAQVQQGKLEVSNVGAAESAVRLVGVMRQFEMMQKAIHIGQEMTAKTIQEVARVGS